MRQRGVHWLVVYRLTGNRPERMGGQIAMTLPGTPNASVET